jgi:hypothetical protein
MNFFWVYIVYIDNVVFVDKTIIQEWILFEVLKLEKPLKLFNYEKFH